MMSKNLVVIGGGAAGFFCAVTAARLNPQLQVTILEKSSKLLSKVRVSGGGRCNVTHACFDIAEMSRRYPRGGNFVKKTFHQFFTTDTIRWFEDRNLELKTEEDGRMFPITDSSQSVIDCLMAEAKKLGVEIVLQHEVRSIQSNGSSWEIGEQSINTGNAYTREADFICIACGGYPKSAMFDWLRQLGHSIEEPVPSLFTFNMPQHPITQLMGISVDHARVRIPGTSLEESGPLLITHWGFSGPAILKLSAWGARVLQEKNWEFDIVINWLNLPEEKVKEKIQLLRYEMAAQKLFSRNPFALPQRLWEFFLKEIGIPNEKRWADLAVKEQNKLIAAITNGSFKIRGKTTFKEEFVTAGGIKLNEVDPNTMMSRKQENIFFAGEILDVDGITGGYNFQHAWTSGFIAGKTIAARSNS